MFKSKWMWTSVRQCPRVGEPGEALTNFGMTIKTLNPQQNQLFVLDIGSSLPKGYVRVPVWLDTLTSQADDGIREWLQACQAQAVAADQVEVDATSSSNGTTDVGNSSSADGTDQNASIMDANLTGLARSVHITRDPGLYKLGDIDVSNQSTVAELKDEILKLPSLADYGLNVAQLRLQEKLGHVKGRILREPKLVLKKSKVAGSGVVLTMLGQEGEQTPQHVMTLRVSRRYSITRANSIPQRIEFNDGPNPSLEALKRHVYALFPDIATDDMTLAKHIPAKGEWKQLETPPRPSTKGKKKKKTPSLKTTPNNLKDGDLIAVKSLLEDPEGLDDFATEYDVNYKLAMSATVEQKRLERSQRSGSTGRRGPEVGVTIAVPDF
eukprot:TRINITY_DN11941_c0_g1_i3.p2 TRINITY_DN11941_c0_g1~~TRINITY_DN11941_c0_g1_i3.p2  ORF type:complete len:381 (+),score=94.77 TRINITY_DN11941_c0_g1_i3:2894-4036(+)